MSTIIRPESQYIGVSTKMYLGYAQSLAWLEGIREQLLAHDAPAAATSELIAFVAPSFPVLESAARILRGTGCQLAAQNCAVTAGAVTGEVSAGLLAELGVQIVELGHAERRADFGEDDRVVAAKVRAATASGLRPLLCIGELEHGDAPSAARQCLQQISAALGSGTTEVIDPSSVLFAYEPVWTIGAAAPATAEHINAVLRIIRKELTRSEKPVALIYGGSAGPGLLPRLPEADGLFLGRFAHDPANFGAVLDEARARQIHLETS